MVVHLLRSFAKHERRRIRDGGGSTGGGVAGTLVEHHTDPIGEPHQEGTPETLGRGPRPAGDARHLCRRLLMERVEEQLDDIDVGAKTGEVRNHARRERLEHDTNVVVITDDRQQGEARPHVCSPPQRQFSDDDLVIEPPGHEAIGIDPVAGDEFGGFAGERVGLVRIRRPGGLVEELANAFEDRLVVLGGGCVRLRIGHHMSKVGDDRRKSEVR